MKLVVLLIASLALTVPSVRADYIKFDYNFIAGYDLSSILQRTAFSKALGDAFNITGRAAKHFSFPLSIEHQVTAMIHESFLQLHPDIIVKIIAEIKGKLNQSLPMLEKYDPALVRDLDQKLKTDLLYLSKILQHGVKSIHHVNSGNVTETEKENLSRLSGFLKWFDKLLSSYPALNATGEYNLKETLLTVIDLLGKARKLRSLRRPLCPIIIDKRFHQAVNTLLLSREFFIFNFRGTLKFLQEHTIKRMMKSYIRAPPVKKMMAHFGAVLSNRTVAGLEQFYKTNGLQIFKEKLRLMLALTFRPEGTFTKPADFIPYMSALIRAIKNLPEKVKQLIPFEKIAAKLNQTDIPAFLERMKKPTEITKHCLAAFKHLPKDIVTKLQARPGFGADAKSYCQLIEGYELFFTHAPCRMLSVLKMAQMKYGIPPRFVEAVKATFAPKSIPFIGFHANNPRAVYKRLRSKGARPCIQKAVARTKGFRRVLRRVKVITRIMFGANACEEPHHRRNSTGPN